jgi:hypothetical protein
MGDVKPNGYNRRGGIPEAMPYDPQWLIASNNSAYTQYPSFSAMEQPPTVRPATTFLRRIVHTDLPFVFGEGVGLISNILVDGEDLSRDNLLCAKLFKHYPQRLSPPWEEIQYWLLRAVTTDEIIIDDELRTKYEATRAEHERLQVGAAPADILDCVIEDAHVPNPYFGPRVISLIHKCHENPLRWNYVRIRTSGVSVEPLSEAEEVIFI